MFLLDVRDYGLREAEWTPEIFRGRRRASSALAQARVTESRMQRPEPFHRLRNIFTGALPCAGEQ